MSFLVLTPNLGIWYPKEAHFELIGYLDADYAGYKVDRKSTTGMSIPWTVPCLLVFNETKFCCTIHGRNGVCRRQ
jgi:hypothetical protein